MGWRIGGESDERSRAPEAAAALAVVAGGIAVAATFAPVAEWASLPAEWLPRWGSYDSFEGGDRRHIADVGDGGFGVPLRAGQEVMVRWQADLMQGGTLRIVLFGPGVSCRTEIATYGSGIAVFRIAEPGIYRLNVHGSGTSRIGGDHRFLGAPPPGYEMIYRASWGPLGDRQRREIAARKPTDAYRAVSCPARRN